MRIPGHSILLSDNRTSSRVYDQTKGNPDRREKAALLFLSRILS
jgi:hypothetical protein